MRYIFSYTLCTYYSTKCILIILNFRYEIRSEMVRDAKSTEMRAHTCNWRESIIDSLLYRYLYIYVIHVHTYRYIREMILYYFCCNNILYNYSTHLYKSDIQIQFANGLIHLVISYGQSSFWEYAWFMSRDADISTHRVILRSLNAVTGFSRRICPRTGVICIFHENHYSLKTCRRD